MNNNPSQELVHLVLVGGGHAHLHVMKELHKRKISGLTITLISQFPYQYYSGMAAAFLEGVYREEEIRFDLGELCKRQQIQFIQGRATRVDGELKKVILSDGREISFTLLSMDTGSQMAGASLVETYGVPVKPLVNLQQMYGSCQEESTGGTHFLIVGAGAAGVEIALAIHRHKEEAKQGVRVSLVEFGDTILKGYQPRLQKQVKDFLVGKKIQVMLKTQVIAIHEKYIMTRSGEKIAYDKLIWAGGVAADPFYRESGLRVDEKGFMLVNSSLQSLSYPFIFGAGDCIAFADYDYVTKVGVYAIREAPILVENILGYIHSKPLQVYIPQRTYLAILSLAHKRGILQYGKLVLKGGFCWKLKDYIDRSFMRKYN